MTNEELAKVVKEIREHCKSNESCRNCAARSIRGCCVFMSGSPNEWVIPKESYKEESEVKDNEN